jgi:tetratricopeptide (TPR) repeat protein
MKIGRNDPCPCNSGRKYKRCCLIREGPRVFGGPDAHIFDPRTEPEIIESIAALKSYISAEDDAEKKRELQLNLAQSYQRRGEHSLAIDVLNEIDIQKGKNELIRKHVAAISIGKLGDTSQAIKLYEEIVNDDDFPSLKKFFRGGIFMEVGKAYNDAGDDDRARESWTKASELFHAVGAQLDYARAQSNLGSLLLHNADLKVQEDGAEVMHDACIIKAQYGDNEGLANNYCTLSLHYWRQKRYGRALAYMRYDLKITRVIGDLHSLCITLSNFAGLYIELKQFTEARRCLKEAIELSNKLTDRKQEAIAQHNLDRLETAARLAGLAGDPIGPKAMCACGSNEEYQDCCGRADYDPPDIMPVPKTSPEARQIIDDLSKRGIEPTPLDFILRKSQKAKDRTSWTRLRMRDGWYEMFELPDMANHYLKCARELCNKKDAPDDIHDPLMTVIMSVCALEAFINQVSYFLVDFQQSGRSWLSKLPSELESGAVEFQRDTNLITKWELLGKLLCGSQWPIRSWQDAKTMISIRNELVHFKSAQYEQVLPTPRLDVDIMRQIPKEIQLRAATRAWPHRLLNPSFANWALTCAESTIELFKDAYLKSREDAIG